MRISEKVKNTIHHGEAPDVVIPGCLVLEGGAMRGVYTCGVLDCLMEHGVMMQTTIGVSAGSMNGYNYLAGNIGRGAMYSIGHRNDKKWIGGLGATLRNKGVAGWDFFFSDEIKKELPFNQKRFDDPRTRFVAVATNCYTGKPEFFEKDSGLIEQAIRASSSMPVVSAMVKVGDGKYLDGGCSVKIPYKWALNEGFEKIIVVRTQDAAYRRDISKKHKVWDVRYGRKPELLASMKRALVDYNEDCEILKKLNDEGRLIMIQPSTPVTIGTLESNEDKLLELYKQGYNDTEAQLENILKYLGIK